MRGDTIKSIIFYGLYGVSSVSMVIFNKSIMHAFDNPHFLLIAQSTVSVLFIVLGTQLSERYLHGTRSLDKSEYDDNENADIESSPRNSTSQQLTVVDVKTSLKSIFVEYFKMNEWKLQHFVYCAPITITFMLMLITSLKGLAKVSVPTVVVFRNVATIFIAGADYLLFKRKITVRQMGALVVIAIGAVVYAFGDIHADAEGYWWIIANTVCVIVNVLLEKYVVVNIQQTPVGVSCYQNLLSALFLVVYIAITRTTSDTSDTQLIEPLTLFQKFMFIGSCIFGFTISVSYFSLQKFASPTSISVAGNMNKFISVIVGAIVFHQALTFSGLGGLVICILGGLVYSLSG
jgi:drug/metabolite transporter (DMT)-like permease